MVVRFAKGEETAYLAWSEANPLGFVWNKGHGTFHRANCRCIRYWAENPNKKTPGKEWPKRKAFTAKVCASTKDELIQVLRTETKGNCHHCSVCNPEGS
jgi:hypothetical protein